MVVKKEVDLITIKLPEKGYKVYAQDLYVSQWNKGQKLAILGVADGTEVQFGNDLVESTFNRYVTDGVVEIPDVMLTYAEPIKAYVQVITADSETTRYEILIRVEERTKPGNYIEPEDEQSFREYMEEVMNETKSIAESVRDDADNGKFNGKNYVITEEDYDEIAGRVPTAEIGKNGTVSIASVEDVEEVEAELEETDIEDDTISERNNDSRVINPFTLIKWVKNWWSNKRKSLSVEDLTIEKNVNIGATNTIAGIQNIVLGENNTIKNSSNGVNCIIGNDNLMNTNIKGSCIIGDNNKMNYSSTEYSVVIGANNQVGADYSLVVGRNHLVSNVNEDGCIIGGAFSKSSTSDLFVLGNGTDLNNRSNAVSISKNGKMTLADGIDASGDIILRDEKSGDIGALSSFYGGTGHLNIYNLIQTEKEVTLKFTRVYGQGTGSQGTFRLYKNSSNDTNVENTTVDIINTEGVHPDEFTITTSFNEETPWLSLYLTGYSAVYNIYCDMGDLSVKEIDIQLKELDNSLNDKNGTKVYDVILSNKEVSLSNGETNFDVNCSDKIYDDVIDDGEAHYVLSENTFPLGDKNLEITLNSVNNFTSGALYLIVSCFYYDKDGNEINLETNDSMTWNIANKYGLVQNNLPLVATSKYNKNYNFGTDAEPQFADTVKVAIRLNYVDGTDEGILNFSIKNYNVAKNASLTNDYYTKYEVENTYAKKSDISNIYIYKGSIAVADLPTDLTEAETGYVYDLTDESDYGPAGTNVAWNGTAWDALGGKFEVETLTQAELDEILVV